MLLGAQMATEGENCLKKNVRNYALHYNKKSEIALYASAEFYLIVSYFCLNKVI